MTTSTPPQPDTADRLKNSTTSVDVNPAHRHGQFDKVRLIFRTAWAITIDNHHNLLNSLRYLPRDCGLIPTQLAADDRGSFGECLELGEGGGARDIFRAAIGCGDQPLRRG